MKDEETAALDALQESFSSGSMSASAYLKDIAKFTKNCTNLDDVSTLIFYCLADESGQGIAAATNVADQALNRFTARGYKPTQRNGEDVTKAVDALIVADSFAKYSRPNDEKKYWEWYEIALQNAANSFDYRLLSGSLIDACKNIEGNNLDPDRKHVTAMVRKAADMCLAEGNIRGMDDVAYMAKNQLQDKELTKYVNALKKKMSK